jgi:hypothetical protein
MNDRREMILSFLVVIQGMSDNFRTLSELFPDFADFASVIEGYRDDFLERAKIPREEFAAYFKAIENEVTDEAV